MTLDEQACAEFDQMRSRGNAQAGASDAAPDPVVRSRHIAELLKEKSQVDWLLLKILERRVIALLTGKKQTLKSFVAIHWAMSTAVAGGRVLLLSAEGEGMQRRVEAWLNAHAPKVDPETLKVWVIERRVDLNSPDGLAAVTDDMQERGEPFDLVVIDAFSKYSGRLDENSNTEVKAFLSELDNRLRKPFATAVLLIAHMGHGDQPRTRGASALEADTEALYLVTRYEPDLVQVTRERFKDAPELPPLTYRWTVEDLGYRDTDTDQPVTSLVLHVTDERPAEVGPKAAALKGKAQRQILRELRERSKDEPERIWGVAEIRAVGREIGIHRNSARDAAEAVAFSPFMTPTIGGYQLVVDP